MIYWHECHKQCNSHKNNLQRKERKAEAVYEVDTNLFLAQQQHTPIIIPNTSRPATAIIMYAAILSENRHQSYVELFTLPVLVSAWAVNIH